MISAGVQGMDLPALMAGAARRIVWHAAIYSPFAASAPHVEAVRTFLGRSETKGLHVISLPRRPEAWCGDFFTVLRGKGMHGAVLEELGKSWRFLDQLAGEFPDRVRLHELHGQPCSPVLLVDDHILYGHYAVSEVPAGEGLWTRLEADVERLLGWHLKGVPEGAAAWERACFRLVSDCANAMDNGVVK
ncbi:hypothetical protein [Salidesulfovibrio onnuriiensis]|uniref:hypothetical protein n=1 Tax=Salidesulfovibrio onnuriiensis TaxID=2583823 RepID=UPI0011CB6D47|nr:hypothetical protein [Salidesulfovibrio onnuriiensis]